MRPCFFWFRSLHVAVTLGIALPGFAEEDTQRELVALREKNAELQAQLQRQQEQLSRLERSVADLRKAPPEGAAAVALDLDGEKAPRGILGGAGLGKVHLSGEGGLAFFRHEGEGVFPNGAFRVDEAKLFIEAPVWDDVYFFSELNFYRREDFAETVNVGEIYLDFENLSKWWNQEGQLSLRIGRLDVPFGEEYLTRDAVDSPLISRSVTDFWGVDEGVEIYGKLGRVQYVLAVQNGGHSGLNDYQADKSVTLRLGYDPTSWLHLGGSVMRTGALDVKRDKLSELWIANGFFRSLGGANTRTFGVELVQGDIQVRWRRGHLGLSGGSLRYSDDDPQSDNGRNAYFYSAEVVQDLTKKLYAAARFGEIVASEGLPLVGEGDFGEYFLEETTERLWRLSLGLGYHFSPNLLCKIEYSLNQGRVTTGEARTHENLMAAEVAFKF